MMHLCTGTVCHYQYCDCMFTNQPQYFKTYNQTCYFIVLKSNTISRLGISHTLQQQLNTITTQIGTFFLKYYGHYKRSLISFTFLFEVIVLSMTDQPHLQHGTVHCHHLETMLSDAVLESIMLREDISWTCHFISYEIFYNINKASFLDGLYSNQTRHFSANMFIQGRLGCSTPF